MQPGLASEHWTGDAGMNGERLRDEYRSRHATGRISSGFALFLFLLFGLVFIFAICRPTLAQSGAPASSANRAIVQDRLNYSDKLRYKDKLKFSDRLDPKHVEKIRSNDKLKPEHVEKIRAERDRLNFQRSRERGRAR